MRYGLLVAFALGGCSSSDLCYGKKGACIGLHLEGNNAVPQVDQLRIGVRLADQSMRYLVTPQSPRTTTLPVTTAISIGDPTIVGESLLSVEGIVDGAVVAGATRPVTIEPSTHTEVMTELAVPNADLRCPTSSLACETFETPLVLEGPLSDSTPLVMRPATDQVFSGKTSYTAIETGAEGSSYLGYGPSEDLVSLGLRAYVYTDKPLADQTNLLAFVLGGGNQFAFGAVKTNGQTVWGAYSTTSPPVASSVVLENGRWLCVEVVLDLHPMVRTAALYATDAFAPDPSAMPIYVASVPNSVLDAVDIGMFAPTDATQQVWFDDIAIARDRVGCE